MKQGPRSRRRIIRKSTATEVDGLVMKTLQAGIKWAGMVRLHQLGENSESLLAECEWPRKSGKVYYACASTGLLFDKQTGACRQSSNVTLTLDSIVPRKCTPKEFKSWLEGRMEGGFNNKAKPGPKVGAKAARQQRDEMGEEEEDEYA